MSRLDPEARALIDLARNAEDGTVEDRTRVRRKVAAALGLTAAGVAGHEAVDSGVQSSLAPLADSAARANGLALVERASGEMLTVATAAQSGGFLGLSASVVLHAAAFLLGGALLGGVAWVAVGGGSTVDVKAGTSLEAPVSVPARESESGTSSSDRSSKPLPLVPQPETPGTPPEAPGADSPISPEDLPMLPERVAQSSAARPGAKRGGNAPQPWVGSSLADEARGLAAVHEALREGEHTLALARLDAMDRRPGGVLGEERLVARVLSLCGLSRVEEAEAVAREVQSVAPESPLLPRLGASCAKGALSP
jgi:hypothetical protein